MKIRDIGKPVTAKSLNESLAARFGKKIDLERFTLEQLEDTRNKLRTKLKAVETMESFESVHNENYQKTKMYLDILNAEISERGGFDTTNESVELSEASQDEAELVMAAKTMVDKLTGWMEDVAEMQTETMLDLADSIREELGSEVSDQFVNTVKPGFEALYAAMEETRKSLTGGVGLLTGEDTGAATLGAEEPGLDGGEDLGAEGPEALDASAGAEEDPDLADLDAELGSEEDMTGPDEIGGPRPKRESFDRAAVAVKKVRVKETMSPTKLATILSKKK